MIYLIGSLRNPNIPIIAGQLEEALQEEIFCDWFGAGAIADDAWRDYSKLRGRTYPEALKSPGARAVFDFDFHHLKRANRVVLVMPAGKSGHLELGWSLGQGKPGYVLMDNQERWDVMYNFTTGVFTEIQPLIEELKRE